MTSEKLLPRRRNAVYLCCAAQAGPPQQRLFPQCITCSDAQSAAVRGGQRTFVTHYWRLRRYHLAGVGRGPALPPHTA